MKLHSTKSLGIKSSKQSGNKNPSIGHPVHNEPAYIIDNSTNGTSNGNVLIIADLHFGLEYSLAKAGAQLPSQTKRITEHIIDLCKRNKVTQLILLGDIKHTVPITSKQEWRELPNVFLNLLDVVESIDIIPGNHDGNLKRLIPNENDGIRFHPASGAVLHGIGFFHGHTWPAPKVLKTNQMIMAHNHPNVLFIDKLGGRVSYSCWVRCRLDRKAASERYPELPSGDPELIIMPAFNDLGSGTPVNAPKPEFLGPILKHGYINLKSTHVYLLDGTDLGLLDKLIDLSSIQK
jgi:putative SbcD/Mre11-related phosphoesterase